MCLCFLLNDSPVAAIVEQTFLATIELLLELIDMSLRDGVNRAQNVPVDEGGTGRGGDRALVDVSVVGVHHLH